MNNEIFIEVLGWVLASYLIGGIPFGYIIGKLRGVDVRAVGSKNIGATNVFRTVGKKWGILAFFFDVMKGLLPVLAAKYLAGDDAWRHLPLVTGVASVLGHTLTPYMKFKGGKGVATAFGMLLGLIPALVGVTFAVFVFFFAVSNFISLGSCSAALFLSIAVWFKWLGCEGVANLPQAILVSLIAIFVIIKHRSNIVRLVKGEENKIYFFKK
ncbi:MAG: glycerol-3-phosphate 1-O-acyltransferase PlsY [Kiritimatiellae bacterium]|nr:glycerol-3-phosphate 1-O-acyltransferase PlsY [Kiritimatiellia bacterium]